MQGLRVFGSRFFWRLYATYSAVLITTALLIGFLVERRVTAAVTEDLRSSMEDACRLIEPYARDAFAGERDPGAVLRRLGAETGLRLTLIRPDGDVLADSEQDPAVMDNHANRPEVLAARQAPFGFEQRVSHSVGYEALYVATLVRDGARELGVVRVAIPLQRARSQLAQVRTAIVVGSVAGLAFALVLGLVVARRTTAPIVRMTLMAQEMRAGKYEGRGLDARADEIGMLADTLHQLGQDVAQRIASMSREDARLRAMVRGMVEGVVAVDDQDRIAFCNDAARRLLGLAPDLAVEGRPIWEVARASGLQDLLEGARSRQAAERRELVVGRAPRELVLEAHANAFQGGGSSGLVVVLHDVTELRRLERVRRDFVANVSHELKTPLTSIKGFVETLLEGAVHEPPNDVLFLERIDRNVDRLTHLVADLLSLARIESQEGMARERVDLAEVVEDVLRRRRETAQQKGLVLDCEARPAVVVADVEALTAVVDNLVDNAIRYTPAPGTIRVRLRPEEGWCVLEVEDTGIGIPEKDRERVFERFYRVDRARSRKLGGTGLGLSIVKNAVQSLGGRVRVESEVGRGSLFVVELPLAPA